MSLNPAQRAAVDLRDCPALVLAGAGTGKTRVITHRVAALLDETIPPWRILAVTFTNRAAREMRERIARLAGDRHNVSEIWVGTFHAICARILRKFGDEIGLSSRFSIYDSSDQISVMNRVLEELNISTKLFSARGVLGYVDQAKNRGLRPEHIDQLDLLQPVHDVVARAYAKYQERLLAADAVDFGDLLLHAVTLLRRAQDGSKSDRQLADLDPMRQFAHRFLHIVVDEFQDTNPVQAELVDRLAQQADLCVVGDDDQSIYGWRGADVDQILRFPDRHPGTEVVRLEQNYRSTMNILRCADAVIRGNHNRLGKTLWSDHGDGEPVRVVMLPDERDEARLVAQEVRQAIDDGADAEEIAIFYRTHAQSRVLEDELRRRGVSVKIVGGVAFYERQEVKDILAYLAVVLHPQSDVHLIRILNRPTRGIGNTSKQRLLDAASARGQSLWEVMEKPAEVGLGKAACRKVEAFRTLITDLQDVAKDRSLDEVVMAVIEGTGYRESLALDDSDEAAARLENLQELVGNVGEFVEEQPDGTIDEYLELVSLIGGERTEGDARVAVTMMTVHSAKGLEFDHVYLTGLEERVFPHARVIDDPVQLEEERRLAYVALTRAKHHLTLTFAARRRLFGQVQVGMPSRFLHDLPPESLVRIGFPAQHSRPRPAAPRAPAWNDDIEYEVASDGSSLIDEPVPEYGESVSIYVGMMVRHKTFGPAEVLGWSGEGAKMKLQLRFSNREVKVIMAKFIEPM